ncbi:uronyl 2-sulfotransferase homolog pip isoform X2 [Bemisia tabaci]
MAVSSTLFLFLHTRELHLRLEQMQVKFQPEESFSSDEKNGVGTMMRQLKTSVDMEELDVNALNNTRKSPKDILFFNRVPKVGSQTFMEMLRRLSARNKFDFHRDHIQRVETIRIGVREQYDLSRMIDTFSPPAVYVKHICFVNFTSYRIPQPIYVNMVRDPVERVISWYYYVRAPWYYVERKQAFPDLPLPDPSWLKKDFETCVLQHDRECQYIEGETREGIGDHRRQTMFFCGQGNECLPFNSQAALENAKRAVEENYAVVGILEDMNTTLTVLENYVPRFFKGSSYIYQVEMQGFRKINRNAFKPTISEEIKNIIRRNFTREIEFYQFCRQRLHKQLYALKLPTMSDNSLK